MKADHINPFLKACTNVMEKVCNIHLNRESIYLKKGTYPVGDVAITVGVTGGFKGEVIFSLKEDSALKIASRMMDGVKMAKLDDLSKSAISELGNIIMGNAISEISDSGLPLDITPPKIITGKNLSSFTPDTKTVCVPMTMDIGGGMEVNIAMVDTN